MNWRIARCLSLGLVVASSAGPAAAVPIELITNGGFEVGSFTGWTVSDLGSGSWFIDTPGTTTPLNGFATAANAGGGSFYAVTDQGGPGTHALLQTFVVPVGATSVAFSFEMFVNDQSGSGGIVDPVGLDHTGPANQHARVDILTASASAFSTAAADVVGNFYLGVDPGAPPNPYTSYLFDITGLVGAGGTFQVRFAETDNQLFLHQGVDNVSILADSASVPEPGTLGLLGLGLAGLGLWRRRRTE